MAALTKEKLDKLAVAYAISGRMCDEAAQKLGKFVVEAAALGDGTVDMTVTLVKPEEKGCCLEACVRTPWGQYCYCVIPC